MIGSSSRSNVAFLLLLLLLVPPSVVEAAVVWTDADGDGLPDTSTPSVAVDSSVTLDVWIDSEGFEWSDFSVFIELSSGLAYDSASFVITGGSNYPIDDFSNPQAIGFAGSSYDTGGVTLIGTITATITAGDTVCASPIIDENNPYETFSQLSSVDSATVFSERASSCWNGIAYSLFALFMDGSLYSGHNGSDVAFPCDPPPPTFFKPRVISCDPNMPAQAGRDTITYVCFGAGGQPVPNLPCSIWVHTATKSGYHNHNSPERPAPTPAFATGNTGDSGVSFRVIHQWGEDTREHRLVLNMGGAAPPGCVNAAHDTVFNWCVRESIYVELPSSGYYERISGDDNQPTGGHPFPTNLYGRQVLIDSLTAVAVRFREEFPRPPGPLLGYNDMSLPWGGVFDYQDDDWTPPHCWHRNGLVCDVRTRFLDNDQKLFLDVLLNKAKFVINRKEKSHFHSWLFGSSGIAPQKAGNGFVFADGPEWSPATIIRIGGQRPVLRGKVQMTHSSAPDTASAGTAVQSLTVTVQVTVTPNTPSTGFYTYDYAITNNTGSTDTVEIFALRGIPLPPTILKPLHWRGFYGFFGDPTAVVWAVSGEGSPPPGWSDPDSNDIFVGQYALRAGQNATGFKLVTMIPPDTIVYFARQRAKIPNDAEQTYPPPDFWTNGATGFILGPGGSTTGVGEGSESESDGVLRSLSPPSPSPSSGAVSVMFQLT